VSGTSTERNWSLWGTMYNSARNALAEERAKKMIAIRSAAKTAVLSSGHSFAVTLGIVRHDRLSGMRVEVSNQEPQ
jgi:hypothetical protein